MFNLTLSRKNLLAILLGFLVIVGLGIITSTISFFVISNVMRSTPVSNFKEALAQQPILTISWILRVISFLSPLLGGIVVGWIVKEKSWLYGGLLGVILQVISIGIAILPLLLPTSFLYSSKVPVDYGYNMAQKNILNQLLNSPIIILLTAVGAYLGERIHKNWKR